MDSERLFATLNAIPQMVWSTLPDGYHDFYNDRWYEFTGVPHGSTDGEGWNGMFHPDDQERAWARWRRSLTTGEPYEIEYRLRHHSGEYRWTLGRALPIRNAEGAISRWFGTCTDIEDLKAAEERRELVARELSHRIKNIFAVVSSLVTLSARNDPAAAGFAAKVGERIDALAKAHEFVRPRGEDTSALGVRQSIFRLSTDLLAPYDDNSGKRIIFEGPDHAIGPIAATSLALVLHELATNAVKYGALSLAGGRVEIIGSEAGDTYRLTWKETGGPPVSGPPVTAGFGTAMAQRAARAQLNASISSDWCPDGLVTKIAVAKQRLAK